MAEIIINLGLPLNASVQPGDIAHFLKLSSNTPGGFTVGQNLSTMPTRIGIIKSITLSDVSGNGVNDNAAFLCDTGINELIIEPDVGDFILFSKDRSINETSILGYYGEFKFENDSKKAIELFAASCEVTANS
tara:strand:+ start:12563 stop:12961 length:399 start_codon:yes stop_codon:yes gene_type:complete